MDVMFAARMTRDAVMASDPADWPANESLSFEHVSDMLARIDNGEITGEKAHRWLGWAQCAAVAAGAGTLGQMKQINHAA